MIVDRRRLGAAITRLRRQAGLTQRQLADRARIPLSTYGQVETGYTLPSLPTAVAIADALCIPVDTLIEDAR